MEFTPGVAECFPHVLYSLKDGQPHNIKEIFKYCTNHYKLTAKDMREMDITERRVFKNRMYWAIIYLKKAGLLYLADRNVYQLSGTGIKLVESGKAKKLGFTELLKYDSFAEFVGMDGVPAICDMNFKTPRVHVNDVSSPKERIGLALGELYVNLSDDLQAEITKMSQKDFINLLQKVLEKLGYEYTRDYVREKIEASKNTISSNIIGFTASDYMGINSVYVHIKQWKNKKMLKDAEVQELMKIMSEQNAQGGICIAPGGVTIRTYNCTKRIAKDKIVFLEISDLASLMIEHGIGVCTDYVYETKKIDYDFFHERADSFKYGRLYCL